jgi:coiled-coil domain-containing protein 130
MRAVPCRWEQYGVIRFEMPYNIWCGGCGKHIRKGTRFNAKKNDAGKYFSTKIYAFHMKCACCPQQIVIQTDPRNSDYVVASGGRRKIETYDEEAAGVERLSTDSEREKLAADPFYKLEHAGRDSAAMREAKPRLTQLMELRDRQRADDFATSQLLRKRHRSRKKEETAAAAAQASSITPLIPLLPETGEDQKRAALVKFKRKIPDKFEQSRIKKRVTVNAGSIFGVRSAAEQKRLNAIAKIRSRGVDLSLLGGGGVSRTSSAPPDRGRSASLSHIRVVPRA